VPPHNLGDLGIPHHPLNGVVLGVAVATSSCTASVVISMATSEAKHFAAAPKKGRSASARSDLAAAA
jgi:hypothetical protein